MEETPKKKAKASDDPPDRVTQVTQTIGSIASTVTACIRSLTNNNAYDAPRGGLDQMSLFELTRYLKAPSLKIPFYFAAQTRMSNSQKEKIPVGAAEIIEVFNAHELASMLALTYIYKRLRTRISNSDDWARISKSVEEHLEISTLLGQALPSIGYGNAILIGTIRPLALGLFSLLDQQGYRDYRRDLKIKGSIFDLQEEHQRWGITHIDVASRLLIQLGFGQSLASDFYSGITAERDNRLSEEQLRIRLTGLWIEALAAGSSPPKVRGEENHQSSGDDLDVLFDSCAQVRNNGVKNSWIGMGKKDISKNSHPGLFASTVLNNQGNADDKEVYAE